MPGASRMPSSSLASAGGTSTPRRLHCLCTACTLPVHCLSLTIADWLSTAAFRDRWRRQRALLPRLPAAARDAQAGATAARGFISTSFPLPLRRLSAAASPPPFHRLSAASPPHFHRLSLTIHCRHCLGRASTAVPRPPPCHRVSSCCQVMAAKTPRRRAE